MGSRFSGSLPPLKPASLPSLEGKKINQGRVLCMKELTVNIGNSIGDKRISLSILDQLFGVLVTNAHGENLEG